MKSNNEYVHRKTVSLISEAHRFHFGTFFTVSYLCNDYFIVYKSFGTWADAF